jgi:hypothetical protein
MWEMCCNGRARTSEMTLWDSKRGLNVESGSSGLDGLEHRVNTFISPLEDSEVYFRSSVEKS